MNKHFIGVALSLISPSALSILPGGCVKPHVPKSVSLSEHHISVKAGQEFKVSYNFGRAADACAWAVINLPSEIALVDYYQLESYPPTSVWVFKPKFPGRYTIFFHNKLSQDLITVHVEVVTSATILVPCDE